MLKINILKGFFMPSAAFTTDFAELKTDLHQHKEC